MFFQTHGASDTNDQSKNIDIITKNFFTFSLCLKNQITTKTIQIKKLIKEKELISKILLLS
jgi:hypothetical protein